jgi:hypothetical protein
MSEGEKTTEELVELVTDIEGAVALLPEEEQRMYEECRQSIVDSAVWLRPGREW